MTAPSWALANDGRGEGSWLPGRCQSRRIDETASRGQNGNVGADRVRPGAQSRPTPSPGVQARLETGTCITPARDTLCGPAVDLGSYVVSFSPLSGCSDPFGLQGVETQGT